MRDETQQAQTKETHKGVFWLVKVFVVFHMVMILSWSLPSPPPAIVNGTVEPTPANIATRLPDFALAANQRFKFATPAKYYLMSTGLWQYWDMFAPNPANLDYWWDSIITFKSGRREVVPYPRMKDMGIFEKYFKERYRKYLERMNVDATDRWKRPTFAQRMALLAYRDPADPPVRVLLRRHYRTMLGMDKPIPKEYTLEIVFDYFVDQEKLRKDAGR